MVRSGKKTDGIEEDNLIDLPNKHESPIICKEHEFIFRLALSGKKVKVPMWFVKEVL